MLPEKWHRLALSLGLLWFAVSSATSQPRALTDEDCLATVAPILDRSNAEAMDCARGLFGDPSQPVRLRSLAIEALGERMTEVKEPELGKLIGQLLAVAVDSSTSPPVASRALGLVTRAIRRAQNAGVAAPEWVLPSKEMLLQIATDPNAATGPRAEAIRGLGQMRWARAESALRSLITGEANAQDPLVARAAAVALFQVNGASAEPELTGLLTRTTDRMVFAVAARLLGRTASPTAMASIVRNAQRFTGQPCVADALTELEPQILAALATPDSPNLMEAIEATRYLWRPGQDRRAAKVLMAIVAGQTEFQADAQHAATERLFEWMGTLDFENEKAAMVNLLGILPASADGERYRERIRQRMGATRLTPVPCARPELLPPAPVLGGGGER